MYRNSRGRLRFLVFEIKARLIPAGFFVGWTAIARLFRLRLFVRGQPDRPVVIGWVEFGVIAAPGRGFEDAIGLAKPGGRQSQMAIIAERRRPKKPISA
jgi:hypothetical protein